MSGTPRQRVKGHLALGMLLHQRRRPIPEGATGGWEPLRPVRAGGRTGAALGALGPRAWGGLHPLWGKTPYFKPLIVFLCLKKNVYFLAFNRNSQAWRR